MIEEAAVSQRAIVDVPVIAGALAHERIATAHIELHAEMSQQEQATIARRAVRQHGGPLHGARPATCSPRQRLIVPTYARRILL